MRNLFLLFSLVFLCGIAHAQNTTLKGTVVDESGLGLPGVNIVVKGTTIGSVTDIDGKFTFTVENASAATLVFSSMGYATQEVAVGNNTEFNIQLGEDAVGLDEVVVTALGIKRDKKALGYSVQEVDSKELTQNRDANFMNALSGKVAGVDISSPSTGASGSNRVIIRGATSFSGDNQPLYVIDGVPIDNTTQGQAGMWGGTDGGNAVSAINPDDIANMSVLKGATAAALYGSRASNGVILITTKGGDGQQKGLGVEINSNITWDMPYDTYELQDQYGAGRDGRVVNSAKEAQEFVSSWGEKFDPNKNVVQFDGKERPYVAQKDNFDKFYQTGFTAANTVSIFNSGKEFNYRLAIGNTTNEGVISSNKLNRNNFTLNVGGERNGLKMNAKVMYSQQKVENRPRLSDSPGNANNSLRGMPNNLDVDVLKPGYYTADVFDENGKLIHFIGEDYRYSNNTFQQNPWFAANKFQVNDAKENFIGSFDLSYQIADGLSLSANVGTNYYNIIDQNIEPTGTGYRVRGQMSTGQSNYWETNAQSFLTYVKDFDKFGINTFVGGATRYNKFERFGLSGQDFVIPFLHTVKNQANQSSNYGFSEFQTNSVFASAEFSYDSMIYLTFTGRNDWFSTFAKDDNSLFYPSVSVSYLASEMFKDVLPKSVDFAKIRGSWAQVSGSTSPYQLGLTYQTVGQGHQGAPLNGISNGSVPNSNLKPYTTTELEVGADFRFFMGRIGIDFAYYQRVTKDDIINVGISKTSGYGSAVMNIGELKNEGFELLLTGTPVQTKDFSLNLTTNFTFNNSEVVNLGGLERLGVLNTRDRNGFVQHVVGERFGSILGYKYRRHDNGKIIVNNEGLPQREAQLSVIGNGTYTTGVGFTTDVRYTDFSLRLLFDSKFGGEIYSASNARLFSRGDHKQTVAYRETGLIFDGVTEDGKTNTTYISPSRVDNFYGSLASVSENFVYDASFIKLREVSLAYNVPKPFLENTFLTSASLSLVARNVLLLWSKIENIDPESNFTSGNGQGLEDSSLPISRMYGFNVNLKF